MANTLTDRAVHGERRFHMTYEEYEQLIDASTHSEWVDGEVTIFMPASERHQRLQMFLSAILFMFVQAIERGIALSEPFEMRLRSGRSYREPDILVVLNEHLHRLDGRRLNGPADLVVEILSPESVDRDQRLKREEYEDGGIPEYWIVDGRDDSAGANALSLTAAGHYETIAPDDRGRIHSRALPGFWVNVEWLTANEPPNAYTALQAILAELRAG
jgi:Uma2 family endonuclease